ncbi:MAG: ribonuclease III [Candidatus Nanoperiomorbaceae bacterium]
MTKAKNQRQKQAVRAAEDDRFRRIPVDQPVIPPVEGVNFAPYQDFAREKLGFEFKNPSLIVTALTHRSYVNEHRKTARAHNERLEFLGDAVLELVSTEYLFRHFAMPEGVLTSWRAALVRTESIRDAGDNLGYQPLIRMSRGEKQGSEQSQLHIVANCFEALTGAIYLDQGFTVAADFISKHILVNLDEILESGSWRDSKSHLQEISQREDQAIPDYRVIDEQGPDHDKIFVMGAFVGKTEIGRGKGSSKQIAQQEAAKMGIKYYRERRAKKVAAKRAK